MQIVLVAGGSGFIGSHLCEKLLEQNYKVICVDNLISGSISNVEALKKNPNFTFFQKDVCEPLDLDEKIDAIFHLASPASPNEKSKISYHALPMETMLVNTQGTLELLKLAEKNNAKFLFASTSEIYGDPLVHPQTEDYRGNVSTTGPRSVYDEAKRFGETLVAYFQRNRGVDGRIARIFNTYGPKMLAEDKRMLVDFILHALKNEKIFVFGDGTQTRSLCYVDDTVEGLLKLMFTQGTTGEIVNIGSPEEHSVMEYAEMVIKLTGSKSTIDSSIPLPKDDPLQRQPDITKAKNLLSWEPKVPLVEGIEKTIQYLKENI